jgi:hypothetical protein
MKIEDLLAVDDTEYGESQGFQFGSVSAGDIYDYFETVAQSIGTPARRLNGIKLVVRSLVNEDKTRAAQTEEQFNVLVEQFKKRNPRNIAKLIEFVLELNGMNQDDAKKTAKNVSSGAQSAVSPSVLQ